MEEAPGRLPRVVACVPVFDSAQFIEQTLTALAQQDYPCLDVLVSDDASADETPEICQRFVRRFPNVSLIRQQRRIGWVENVNVLLQMADGKYFFIAPHDDLFVRSYVSRLVKVLEDSPKAVLAFADTEIRSVEITRSGPEPRIAAYKDLDGVTDRLERGVRVASYHLSVWPDTVTVAYRGLFRASAYRDIGGMQRNPAGEFGADWAWLLRMALLGEFVRVPEPLVIKHLHPRSLSHSWRYTLWNQFGEQLGCAASVRRAQLPFAEECRIQWQLLRCEAMHMARRVFRGGRHWLRWQREKLRCRLRWLREKLH